MVKGNQFHERLARWSFNLFVIAGLSFIILPLVLVVWFSFVTNTILTFPPQGYSFAWYGAIFDQPQFVNGLVTSFILAVCATFFALMITIPAAFVLVRSKFPARQIIMQILMLPLIVPAIVIGAAIYMAFVQVDIVFDLEFSGSLIVLVIGHLLLCVPWSLRLICANLVSINPALEEAALSLGARPLSVALLVTLPIIWPGVVASALFSFVVSFGNLEVSLFLTSAGRTTLPIAVLQYLEWKIDPTVAAISVIQIIVIAAALLVTNCFVNLTRTL